LNTSRRYNKTPKKLSVSQNVGHDYHFHTHTNINGAYGVKRVIGGALIQGLTEFQIQSYFL